MPAPDPAPMNVSRDAYYTAAYLKNQRYRQERVLRIPPGYGRVEHGRPETRSMEWTRQAPAPAPVPGYPVHTGEHMAAYPYNAYDEAAFCGADASLCAAPAPWPQPQPQPHAGYYIGQQQKHDEAPVPRPDMHRHRTSLAVFVPGEPGRTASPMDAVFEDPSKRDLNKKQKVARAFRLVRSRFARAEHAPHDYSPSITDDQPASLVVRREGAAPEPNGAWVREAEHEHGDAHGHEHGDEREHEHVHMVEHGAHSPARVLRGGVAAKAGTAPRDRESRMGSVFEGSGEEAAAEQQPPGFHPAWTYVLSWLVYASSDPNHDASEGKVTEIRDEDGPCNEPSGDTLAVSPGGRDSPHARGTTRHRQTGHRYKGILHKWSQPALSLRRPLSPRSVAPRARASKMAGPHSGAVDVCVEQLPLPPLPPLPPCADLRADLRAALPGTVMSNVNGLIKSIRPMRVVFAPIDAVAECFPQLQTLVVFMELFIFMWILYELSLLIDALCMAVKAVCAPVIAIGRFMNRIV